MADSIPLYDDGDYLPCKAAAGVLGRRFVKVSGNRSADGNISVALAGAGEDVFGVAQFDPRAEEDSFVTVAAGHGLIMEVDTGAAVAAGQAVQSNATGQAIPLAAGVRAGKAIDAGANPGTVFVQLHG